MSGNLKSGIKGKQGLGFDIIVDGLSIFYDLGVEISDPASLENVQNYIDNVTAKTRNNKTEQPDELADPLTRTITVLYNANNAFILSLLKSASRKKLRCIQEIMPLHPTGGAHNAGIKGTAFLIAESIESPLDGFQAVTLTIKYQEVTDENRYKQDDYDLATVLTVTPVVGLVAANVVPGTVLATLSADGTVPNNIMQLIVGDDPGVDDDDNDVVGIGVNPVDGETSIVAIEGVVYSAGVLDFFVGTINYALLDEKDNVLVKADFDAEDGTQVTLA